MHGAKARAAPTLILAPALTLRSGLPHRDIPVPYRTRQFGHVKTRVVVGIRLSRVRARISGRISARFMIRAGLGLVLGSGFGLALGLVITLLL